MQLHVVVDVVEVEVVSSILVDPVLIHSFFIVAKIEAMNNDLNGLSYCIHEY